MDFLELTNSEYKKIYNRLVWRTPYVRIMKAKWTLPAALFLFVLFTSLAYIDPELLEVFAALFAILGIGLETGVLQALIVGLLTLAAFILFLHIVFLLCLPTRVRFYIKPHRGFVSAVNQLDAVQAEMLSSEYPNRKRVDFSLR